ncbi:GHKL domain-containing protein [Flavobacterium sp. xlx-214]|uniref:sensor histidine kinase n=1 Tax=unclassified Flavobacterium TaxID=196869 RepID=UPI0013D590C9|nr:MULTISPECIES: ATP-binding protein [unclassified Flavobacterium]MBA5791765.1 GHKL domain-containing protein [Flavobacterium sp. xlx-221]QMI83004.1 GHKL domain-containing protein [Flavobacterium sp. xlx-214]
MKQPHFAILLGFRLSLAFTFLFLAAFFAFKSYVFTFVFLLIVAFCIVAELVYFVNRYFSQNQKIINALLFNDFSLNINNVTTKKSKSLHKLYQKIKEEHTVNKSKEIVYQQLLNAVPLGFLVLKATTKQRSVVFMNQHFQNLFQLPPSTSWDYLKKFIPQFCHVLEQNNFEYQKTTLDIQINNEEKQTYMLQVSTTNIAQEMYHVVFLDSIQRVIDTTEKEAWMNIMKVMAHEIINSLTPIYSLANSTKMYLEEDVLAKQDIEDIRLSLDTIMSRSVHLQKFVEQYRQLTMLSMPVKANHDLKELINKIIHSFHATFQETNIECSLDIPSNLIVQVDRVQFEQVLINLIKNAIHSVANTPVKEIKIHTKQTENRLYIFIQDSGEHIDQEIVSKIFLPFFTTRKEGAGIGLSLSKSIIEAHRGYLYYQQNEDTKQFVIVLTQI